MLKRRCGAPLPVPIPRSSLRQDLKICSRESDADALFGRAAYQKPDPAVATISHFICQSPV
jgi:hypothetical protein